MDGWMDGCIIGAGSRVEINYTVSLLKIWVMSFLRITCGTNTEVTWEMCH